MLELKGLISATLIVLPLALTSGSVTAQDALPSWADGASREAIIAFVDDVSDPQSANFVPAAERIAVFDNDGTLWIEQPIYTQLQFALDRVQALAPDNPDWTETEPFSSVLEGDLEAVVASGKEGLLQLIMATHAGMTTEEFETVATSWIESARHPRFDQLYTDLTYQPMQELIDHLEANEFKVYIVSGGGIAFMRPWTEEIYGIPPEQVIGSSIRTTFEIKDGVPVIVRQPEIDFIDDKEGKPVAIDKFIGRRPILAVGNSDGDLQMLQWTTAGEGPRLGVIVRHDDGEREYAYDREGHVGRLDKALDLAGEAGWIVVSMANDWTQVFAHDEP